jgi:C-terminal peptidase prc
VFEELWTVVDKNYLYPDFNGLDWDAVQKEYFTIIDSGLTDDEFYMLMNELVLRLGDDHSAYFNPSEVADLDAETNGQYKFVGIGILGTVVEGKDYLTVILTFPGGPAEKAGLKAHDNILKINNTPIVQRGDIRFDLIRGTAGSQVDIIVQSPFEEPRNLSIVREEITGNFPVPYSSLVSPLGKHFGYILLASFRDSNVDENVEEILEEFGANQPIDGLIIDNRFNRGGGSDVLINLLSFFIDGKAGYFVQREKERLLSIEGVDILGSQNIPLVILIGPDTASFGEVFSGILKDQNRAYLIGLQTEGNVEVLHIYDFVDGSRAWIAQESFRPVFNPDQEWERTGIIPHHILPSKWDEFTFENDPLIQSAIQYLDGNQE